MRDFAGRTAFVTGGASGIGLALGHAFWREGMNVVLADVEAAALDAAVARMSETGDAAAGLTPGGATVRGVVCDVADAASMQEAARTAFDAFGKVHVLCNNAGVSRAGRIETIAESDWEWVIGVNLRGTVHGLQAFVPHMRAHGEPAHIVNTASMAGLVGGALSGPYAATKFGIVGLSEVLAAELEGSEIGVSVLCPAWVQTRMLDNGRNRPTRHGGPFSLAADTANAERNAHYAAALRTGMEPAAVAALVLDAIRTGRRYVFTHPDRRDDVAQRFAAILADLDAVGGTR